MASSQSKSTLLFRVGAFFSLLLGLLACAMFGEAAVSQLNNPANILPATAVYGPSALSILAGIVGALVLEAMARLTTAPAPLQPATPKRTDGSAEAILQLTEVVESLRQTLLTLSATQAPSPQIAEEANQIPAESSGYFPAQELTTQTVEAQLNRMIHLLEEIKEVSMLDENQRQTRRTQVQNRRKQSRVEEAASLIQRREWQQADALLHLLQSLHPDDAQVQAMRADLVQSRDRVVSVDWERLVSQVQDKLAVSAYDPAIALIEQFLETNPGHADGQALLQRVRSEKHIVVEREVQRAYEEIKSAAEARQWRSALDGIQIFLQNFPEHPRADKIRQQIRVIQKNAEIEERHEHEARIRELVKAGEYARAAEAGEDLMQRFPDSPQAQRLAPLMEKLRERAAGADNQVFTE